MALPISREASRIPAGAVIDFLDRVVRLIGRTIDGDQGSGFYLRRLRDEVARAAKSIPPVTPRQADEAMALGDELADIAMEVWGTTWGEGEFAGLLAAMGVVLAEGIESHAVRDPGLRSAWRALSSAHRRFLGRLEPRANRDDLEHGRETGMALAAMLFRGALLEIEDEPAGMIRAA